MNIRDYLAGAFHRAINWLALEVERTSLYDANRVLQDKYDASATYAQTMDLEVDRLLNESEQTREIIAEKEAMIISLQPWNTALDSYCRKAYTIIDNIAYEAKRNHQGEDYSIYLQECITPEAWEVKNFYRRTDLTGSNHHIAEKAGNRVGHAIKWTDDKTLSKRGDYYFLPSETIVAKKGDCEDHTFLAMSAHKEIGGAWGSLIQNGKKVWHAFNVLFYDGELWVLETTGSKASMRRYEGSDYDIYFIITRSRTYRVKHGVAFGVIAGWT